MFYPAIEMVDEWRLRRSTEKDLAQMRMTQPPATDGTSPAINGWLEFLPPLVTLEDANARS
jgi:hypothetical protein